MDYHFAQKHIKLESDSDKIEAVGKVLVDINTPLQERFRALFTLRNLGGDVAIRYISDCFTDSSELLKHELAYCLGQMQDRRAIPILTAVLRDENQEAMVRHEAAEGLAAIGASEVLQVLCEFSSDPVISVAETCQLGVRRVEWLQCDEAKQEGLIPNPYQSVDPAPPSQCRDITKLQNVLVNEELPLFDRYRAMFSLRNFGTDECVSALTEGLKCSNALFCHEIAYVLGQMQNPACVEMLTASLKNKQQDKMVRHECAEALGSVATPGCMQILRDHLHDDERVVRESCEVALDMSTYENSQDFQYANSLQKL